MSRGVHSFHQKADSCPALFLTELRPVSLNALILVFLGCLLFSCKLIFTLFFKDFFKWFFFFNFERKIVSGEGAERGRHGARS